MGVRVAYLLGSLNRGGTETLLLDVFRNAKLKNLDAIGVYRKSGMFEKEFSKSGVEMNKLTVGKNPIAYLLSLRRLLKTNTISIAHAQQPIDALYAWLACLGTGIKIVLTFHGYDFNDNIFGNLILRFIIKKTDLNIYVSDTQRKYYEKKYRLKPNKQIVVYNGISFEKFNFPIIQGATLSHTPSSAPSTETLRTEFKLSSETLLMGAVGNFVPGRDQYTLCRFLKLLKDKNVDFHFIFVGKKSESSPHLYDGCFNYCKQHKLFDKVTFLGSRNDVPTILDQLDAFLFATDHDTFGIAVVEAMAVGTPVFVNDWDVMTEITEQGKYTTLYKTKDENDLLREFMLFLQNKDFYKAKAKSAATFVRNKYSIEKHIENLKLVYRMW